MSNYINKETNQFFESSSGSELLIQKCEQCGEYVFFPREFCPKDMGKLTFVKSSGKGKILTYSIVVRSGEPLFSELTPYVAAIVKLDEGPTMFARIDVPNPKDVTFNQEVEVVFKEHGDKTIPVFRPVN